MKWVLKINKITLIFFMYLWIQSNASIAIVKNRAWVKGDILSNPSRFIATYLKNYKFKQNKQIQIGFRHLISKNKSSINKVQQNETKKAIYLSLPNRKERSVGFGSDGNWEDANHRWSGVHQSNHYSQIL